MKKITYSLNLGLIGSLNSGKELFVDYLEKEAVISNISNMEPGETGKKEFLIVFKEIPIKVKVFSSENLNKFLFKYENLENVDVLVLTLNVHDLNSLKIYNKENLKEFYKYFTFRGLSILAGIHKDYSSIYRISKVQLINKAKDLDLLYCFEIQNKNNDMIEFYSKVFNDLIFKFQFSSPEIFELAKSYGIELLKQNNSPNNKEDKL